MTLNTANLPDKFDKKVIDELGYYVYMLVDKTTGKPFYIGKGCDNRIFDHVYDAVKNPNSATDKSDKIRELLPDNLDYIIVRHKLTEAEAYMLEASLIDVLESVGIELTNIVGGHHTDKFGLLTVNQIRHMYSAIPLTSMGKDCVIININRTCNKAKSIYDATRSCWKLDKNKLKGIKYVLAEYRGLIVEVFEVGKWIAVPSVYGSGCKNAGKSYTRYEFDGKQATSSIRNQYIGKSVTHVKKQGQANPVTYRL